VKKPEKMAKIMRLWLCGTTQISRDIIPDQIIIHLSKKKFFSWQRLLKAIFNVFSILFQEKIRQNARNWGKEVAFASGEYLVAKKSVEFSNFLYFYFSSVFHT
jgi:hypothetical protein